MNKNRQSRLELLAKSLNFFVKSGAVGIHFDALLPECNDDDQDETFGNLISSLNQPSPQYRKLTDDEPIQAGDEFLSSVGTWLPSGHYGKTPMETLGTGFSYRRRI